MIDSQLPTALIKRPNPLFDRLFNRLRWPPARRMDSHYVPISKIALIRRFTVVGCLIPFLLIMPIVISDYGWNIVLSWVSLIAGAFGLLADIYYAITAINNIAPQITGQQWELLRLTTMTEADILLANYATIQIRVWRVTVIETALRIFGGLASIASIKYFLTSNSSFSQNPLYLLFILGPVASTLVYLFEPLWRMRVITLLGMTTATASSHEYGMTVITAVAWVIGFLIVEFLVNSLLSIIVSLATSLGYTAIGANWIAIPLFILHFVVVTGGLYLFFRIVRGRLLRRLQRVAFHE